MTIGGSGTISELGKSTDGSHTAQTCTYHSLAHAILERSRTSPAQRRLPGFSPVASRRVRLLYANIIRVWKSDQPQPY
jgi:hypothetical protein